MKRPPALARVFAQLPIPDLLPNDALLLDRVLLGALDRGEAGLFVVADPTPYARTELLHSLSSALFFRDPTLITLSLRESLLPVEGARNYFTREEDGNLNHLDRLVRRVSGFVPPANVLVIDSVLEGAALRAALEQSESRLVIIGLEATRASEIPRRLLSMGADPQKLGHQLRGICAQRRYERACSVCAQRGDSPMPSAQMEPRLPVDEGWWLYRTTAGVGDQHASCAACDADAPRGYVYAHEMCPWAPHLREELRKGDLDQLEQAMEFHMGHQGHELFFDRALRYARRGLVYADDLREW